MPKFFKEFRDFAVKGNVVDLAVGIIIGSAFTAIVNSLVKDIFTPVLGLITGGINFTNLFFVLKDGTQTAGPYNTLADAQAAGAVTINYGIFLNAMISFTLVAMVCFVLIRNIHRIRELGAHKDEAPAAAPTVRNCPYCITPISIEATRCPSCTSELDSPKATVPTT
ncbi:large-conductance mechanosensitive channel [Kushneria pakistanensis]|uniref:Large-conductance mechanosensitive channel n=1 Tax=Kushneria pakistanensis TaxID=1508770 RepID=A0ABQ3FE41_9GAMM|nr:large conductance mechanosensitive channel protein MscL [Kushneria pakistanensis]GHC20431.1 large-conductance mechanosensitive channel [Kushneria pakistanensis]